MAKKNLADVMAEIEKLQREAERLKREEVDGVIGRIKEAIATYGLTAADLGLAGAAKRAGKKPAAGRKRSPSAGSGVRYRDAAGNTWGGRGPRPKWLRDAVANGQPLSDFAAG